MQEFLWEKERERERERSEIQKSWRITRASKSLEFHPGKKEIGEWVGRGDIPRASGFVWTPITPVSRNGRRRREPIRPDTPGISGEDPYADSSRVALESNVGELARDVARDRRTFVRDFATKEEGRKKSYASEFVARARTRVLLTSSGTIDSNFHVRKNMERWKGGSRVEILCSLFVNLLAFEIYRCHRPIGILPDFYLLAIT